MEHGPSTGEAVGMKNVMVQMVAHAVAGQKKEKKSTEPRDSCSFCLNLDGRIKTASQIRLEGGGTVAGAAVGQPRTKTRVFVGEENRATPGNSALWVGVYG